MHCMLSARGKGIVVLIYMYKLSISCYMHIYIYALFVSRLRSASLEVVRLLIASNAHVNHSYKKKLPYTTLTPTPTALTTSLTSASFESQTISGSPLPTLTLAAVTPLCYVLEQAALATYSTSELIAQHQRYIHKHHSHLTNTHTYTNTSSSENKPPSNSPTPTPYTHGISQLSPVENASFFLRSSQLKGSNTLASYAMVHDSKAAITQPSSARKTWVSVLALLLDAGM